MANALIGFPNYSDGGVLYSPTPAGGSWSAGLPLSNLQNRYLHKVARSATAALADTRFRVDLGADRSVRVFAIPKHTLSSAGRFRVLARPDNMLFDYEAGDDITLLGGVHTRADATTCATYVDRNGVVRTVAANVLRDSHFIGGIRHALLEGARANVLQRSQELNDAYWTKTRATITPNAVIAPDGSTTADKLVEDSTASDSHFLLRASAAFSASTLQPFSMFAKAAERTWIAIQTSAGGTRTSFINLSAGTAGTVAAGHTVRITPLALGWYRVQLVLDPGANTSTNLLVMLSTGDTIQTYSGDGASGVYLWGMQHEVNGKFATSYIATTTGTVTREADSLYFPFNYLPQAMTVYLDTVDVGMSQGGDAGYWAAITGAAGGAPSFTVHKTTTTQVRTTHNNGTAAFASTVTSTAVGGDRQEIRSILFANGSAQTAISVNGAAESLGVATDANALAAAWSDTRLYINSLGSGSQGFNAIRCVRILTGSSNSLATMQASVMDSGWLDAWPAGHTAETLEGMNFPLLYIPSADFTARYVSWQFDDALNSATYIDLSRLVVAKGWQPSINMSYGAKLGVESETAREITDGGAAFYSPKPRRRSQLFTLADLPETEMLANAFDLQRLAGTHGQLFFVYDPDDTTHMHRRAFLAVLKEPSALEFPYNQRGSMSFSLVEEL